MGKHAQSMIVAALLLAASMATGCVHSPPLRPQSVRHHSPEKDVVHVRIEMPRPAPADQYLALAEEQLAQLGSAPNNPEFPNTPIYELYYSFFRGGDRLASVHFRMDSDQQSMEHYRTLVFRPQQTQRGQIRPASSKGSR